MKFKELVNAKVVEAYIPPFNQFIRCSKIEEFDQMRFIDGEAECIGVEYTIKGKIGSLEISFMVDNQDDCDKFQLKLIKKRRVMDGKD